MASKLCVDCGVEPKRQGSTKWCQECWLTHQPVPVRVAAARQRLAAMPVEARKARVPERDWPSGRRWCAGCQSFVRLRDCQGSRCKACASAANHERKMADLYELEPGQYDALFAAQHGRCWLCRRKSPSGRLAVDHDHKTGEVRGLLCPGLDWGCNAKIISRFDADDDPVRMARRLVLYLSDPPARKVLGR